jgi:hypothetical protein
MADSSYKSNLQIQVDYPLFEGVKEKKLWSTIFFFPRPLKSPTPL